MKHNRRNFIKNTAALTALTAISPVASFAKTDNSSFKSKKGNVFLTKPYLQNPTETSITIMWIVNRPSYSYVEFGKSENLGLTANKIDSGLVVAYNRINSISLTDLQPGTTYFYRVVSKEISKFSPYNLEYGKTIKSTTYSFTTPDYNSEDVSMLIFNDVHDRPESIPHLLNLVDTSSTDLVFFNGDIFNHMIDEEQIINHFLDTCGEEFATETPFYFVRGNNETRGNFRAKLQQYFSNPEGKQYYDFKWGATHFTVIDTGEDKPDDHEVYGGIVAFDAYREEQLVWFKEVIKTNAYQEAKFRVVLMHIPMYYSDEWHGTTHVRKLFSSAFNEAEIDLCISGHTHKYEVEKPKKNNKVDHNYPIIIGGGPKNGNRTIISLKANAKELELKMVRDDGKEVGHIKLDSKR